MSPQTATCLNRSQRGSQGGGRETPASDGHQDSWQSLGKGITSSSITAMQCESLVPHEMKLESLPPKKLSTQHSASSRGEALKNPQELNLLEIFSLVPLWPTQESSGRSTPEEGWRCDWLTVLLPWAFLMHQRDTSPGCPHCHPSRSPRATNGPLWACAPSPAFLLLLLRRAATSTTPAWPS